MKQLKNIQQDNTLFLELSQLIEQSQRLVVSQANSTLTLLFWQVGKQLFSLLEKIKCDHFWTKFYICLKKGNDRYFIR
jgi:hypothetical protein